MTPEQEKQYAEVFDKVIDEILNQDVHPKDAPMKFTTNGICPFESQSNEDERTVCE
jgi:hypothetical protein